MEGRLVGCPCFEIFRSGAEVRSAKVTKLWRFGHLSTFTFVQAGKVTKLWVVFSMPNIYTPSPEKRYNMRWAIANAIKTTKVSNTSTTNLTKTNTKITPQQHLNHQKKKTSSHLSNTSWTQRTNVSTLRAVGMRPKQVFARNSAHRKGGERSANMFCWCYVRVKCTRKYLFIIKRTTNMLSFWNSLHRKGNLVTQSTCFWNWTFRYMSVGEPDYGKEEKCLQICFTLLFPHTHW